MAFRINAPDPSNQAVQAEAAARRAAERRRQQQSQGANPGGTQAAGLVEKGPGGGPGTTQFGPARIWHENVMTSNPGDVGKPGMQMQGGPNPPPGGAERGIIINNAPAPGMQMQGGPNPPPGGAERGIIINNAPAPGMQMQGGPNPPPGGAGNPVAIIDENLAATGGQASLQEGPVAKPKAPKGSMIDARV